jgi:hypothetical protein
VDLKIQMFLQEKNIKIALYNHIIFPLQQLITILSTNIKIIQALKVQKYYPGINRPELMTTIIKIKF